MASRYGGLSSRQTSKRGGMLQSVRLPSDDRVVPFVGVLTIARVLWVFGLFIALDLLHELSSSALAFGITAVAGVLMAGIQRPFSRGPPLLRRQLARAAVVGMLSAASLLLYIVGLLVCGPLWAVLLGDFSGTALLGIAAVLLQAGSTPAGKVRGAFLGIGALVLVLLLDEPTAGHAVEHVEGDGLAHQDYHTVRHNKYFTASPVSDRTAGGFALLSASALRLVANHLARALAVDVGGSKRVEALTHLFAALCLLPMTWFHSDADEGTKPDALSLPHLLGSLVLCSTLMLVFIFYAESATLTRTGRPFVNGLGLVVSFVTACLMEALWMEKSTVSVVLVVAFVALAAAHRLLSGAASSATSSRGTLVGYAPDGLPLYRVQSLQRARTSLLAIARSTMRAVLENYDSRQIFYFLCLNFSFMLVELFYGSRTNSLGLLSDAFHMLFDCAALLVGLCASIMAKWTPTPQFPYGFGRVEVFSGFVNGLLLVVIALGIFKEACLRLESPPQIATDRLLLVSFGGLLVNVVGVVAFSHAHSHAGGHGHSHGTKPAAHHGHSHASWPASQSNGHGNRGFKDAPLLGVTVQSAGRDAHGAPSNPVSHKSRASASHRSRNTNMQGVYLHVLADMLGSVGVLFSTLLVEHLGWMRADPLCSLMIAVLILLSVVPLIKQSASILLLQTPEQLRYGIPRGLQQLRSLPGVAGYRFPHFWEHTPGTIHGTIHVVAETGTAGQAMAAEVASIFKAAGVTQLTVQVQKSGFVPRGGPAGVATEDQAGSVYYEPAGVFDIKSL